LRGSAVKEPPVANPRAVANARDPRPKPQWVTPRLVAEVRFAEYTAEGVLRHASFMGLREDKPAAEVVAEVAVDSAAPNVGWTAPTPAIAISHPDRVVFGASGITKGQLASWYEAIAPRALAWVGDRPLSLVRAPDGIDGQKFFQKHLTAGFGKQVGSVMLAQGKGPPEPTIMVTDKAGLLRCVQMGTIEFHGWGARAGDVEHPDRLVIDLDPDEGLDFTDVKRAAVTIRDHLADLGLTTFPLLSGGKGVHVIAPLTPAADWDAVEDFAHRFARALEGAEPQRFVATMAKAKRKGRIFVDWLRNQRGSTAILPWSVRARDGAPVAVPVTWEMLSEARAANLYTLADPAAIIAVADALPPGWGQADQVLVGG
jgi:bifunctional non-homologous end joining protein LigD